MKRGITVFLGVCTLVTGIGLGFISWSFDVARAPEVTADITTPTYSYHCIDGTSDQPLDQDGALTVSVWNIYKQQRENWRQALELFTADSELVLLQEASLTTALKDYLDTSHWQVTMANAFKFFNTSAGVMNLSSVEAIETCAYLAMEPWLRLPKSALLARFSLSNGQVLAVVNLHGLNFALGLEEYKAQMDRLGRVLAKHQGPVILAGDFNSWRQGRIDVVRDFAEGLQLKAVVLNIDQRSTVLGKPLDHLYYRGLRLMEAEAPKTEASDHNPIIATFRL
ncbi:endonuclease/exonuclease/phosphatase family protein [Photobacterium sp.]|uniref:endonuclease/exonuclease/phosphatase family protein n=1 Tax=Photobacterium sp. TaxID=660 RepID=UPI00299E92AB|nr:endonuclease/exonuclease/phosphatase family protein [Photobacterium sp.]MDX1304406.1 endonuclease/exonuclease/phosphatase family protein [Photobacterium sp.]